MINWLEKAAALLIVNLKASANDGVTFCFVDQFCLLIGVVWRDSRVKILE